MLFKVYLMRTGGRRRSWRDILNGPAYVGDLRTMTEKRGDAIYTQALLVSAGALAETQLPTLYEPVLVSIAPMAMRLRGFEGLKGPEGFYAVVQEWHCIAPSPATALQTLFARLVESSMKAGMLPQQETAMRLALKAQSQCRATLETLVAIKKPPIVYAKQANLTTGPQQINNAAAAPQRARGKKTKPTQLSGGSHELLSDTRTSSVAR